MSELPGNADVLVGNPGNADVLVGNPGNADVLVGNPGNADVLVGMDGHNADEDVGAPRNDAPVGTTVTHADEDVGAPRNGAPRNGAPRNGAPNHSTPNDARKEWYSRGYLPHRNAQHLIQSVTYRLADSLPQTKLDELKQELARIPENQRESESRKRIETWLDAGMGCCALRHPEVAHYVQNSFLHFHGTHYHLHAWCVMPNHVHVLLEPLMGLATIVQGWKSFTARWILKRNEQFALKIPSSEQLWMREYWDRYIRDAEHYRRAVEYIHQNPAKAKLCQTAEAWPWSSASAGNADVLGAPTSSRRHPWER